MALIHEKMIAIMRDTTAIAKSSKNAGQGFMFRGIDAVMNDLHGLFCKHGVFLLTERIGEPRIEKIGDKMIHAIQAWRFHFVAEDGSEVAAEVVGQGADTGDKAMNKSASVALKYALLQAFLIPTEEKKDPDEDSPVLCDDESAKSIAEEIIRRAESCPAERQTKILAYVDKEKNNREALKSALAKLVSEGY